MSQDSEYETKAASVEQNQQSQNLTTSIRSSAAQINGRYEIRSLIARGGMGSVHRAWDYLLERSVAVKVLLISNEQVAKKRFEHEALITAKLQHPNIPPIHDLGHFADGEPFLAMKLIEGCTLSELLKSDGHGSSRWLATFESICQAVGYAHMQGFIHRDLKPLNVMVGMFGEVQVMDWGLAKQLNSEHNSETHQPVPTHIDQPFSRVMPDDVNGATLIQASGITGEKKFDGTTKFGSVLGTPSYMSPEQARGEIDRIDRRSDVFSLGAILCEMLTGLPPLIGDSIQVIDDCSKGQFEKAYQRLDQCADDLALIALTKRCLSVNPDGRPADAVELLTLITRYRNDAAVRAKELERKQAHAEVQQAEQRKRRRLLGWSAVTIMIALLAGLAVAMMAMLEAKDQERIASNERRTAEIQAIRANREAEAASEVSEFLVNLFEPTDKLAVAAANLQFRQRAGASLLARDVLARGVAMLKSNEGLNRHPLTRARLLHEIASIHMGLGEAEIAHPLCDEALAIRSKFLEENDPQLVKSLKLSGQLEYLVGDYHTCVSRLQDVITRFEESKNEASRLDLAETQATLGIIYLVTENRSSIKYLQLAYDAYRQLLGSDHIGTLTTGCLLVVANYHVGDMISAYTIITELSERIKLSKSDPELKEVFETAMQLVKSVISNQKNQQLVLFRSLVPKMGRVFGESHVLTSVVQHSYANALYTNASTVPRPTAVDFEMADMKSFLDALSAGKRPTPVDKQIHPLFETARIYAMNMSVGPKWSRASNRFNLARTLMRCNSDIVAEQMLRKALDEMHQLPPEVNKADVPHALQLLGWLIVRNKRNPDQIEPVLREALSYAKTHSQYVHPNRLYYTVNDLGHVLMNKGSHEEASTLFAEAASIAESLRSPMKKLLSMAFQESTLRKMGKVEEADKIRSRLLEQRSVYRNSKADEAIRIRQLLAGYDVSWP